MPLTYYRFLRGRIVLVGKQPDGDSVRFIADLESPYADLGYAERVRPGFEDGSVQLRLEGIDTPEVHYGDRAQPMGNAAREALLAMLGFSQVVFETGEKNRVAECTPESVEVAILTRTADANGRVVSYLLPRELASAYPDGTVVQVDEALLGQTYNQRLVAEGWAYPMAYTATPRLHRARFAGVAAGARQRRLGVWALDRTPEFLCDVVEHFGPAGQLVFPKLFRRATDYLDACGGGFRGNLADWLVSTETRRGRNENDRVVIAGRVETRLSELLLQRNRRVSLQADLLELAFVEH